MGIANKTLLVLGGSSDIGRMSARIFASHGWNIQLAGRSVEKLEREADDIRARSGTDVSVFRLDVLETDTFTTFVDGLPRLPDAVLCVAGLLGDQHLAETDLAHAELVMRSNYTGPALLVGLLAERFLTRANGCIIGVSSVAGDRGRASNYIYGSAKAGFTAFLSGLRNRCAKKNVHVLTVKPGFVRTQMTAGLDLPNALTSSPEHVAEVIYRAVEQAADVIYVSGVWRFIMLIIQHIPEVIFKKLKI